VNDLDGIPSEGDACKPEENRAHHRLGLAVTWAGHATALIELDGLRILTDPVLRDRVGLLRRLSASVDAEIAERIDAVLLSHLHADHTDLRSLRTIGSSTRVLAPRGAGRWLRRHGFREVDEIGRGEEVRVGSVRMAAVPATHDSRRWPLGVSADPIGFVVQGSQTCYFAGDTDLFDAMSTLAGSIDVALLPVWGWGGAVGPGHLDPARAARAAALIVPRVVVPIHWGTFALARPARRPRDPGRAAREFIALVARDAPGVEVHVLEHGGRIELDRPPEPPQ
jgi:L-ascorbate metabolism protein UlaG (beta-lactamase superfamily)